MKQYLGALMALCLGAPAMAQDSPDAPEAPAATASAAANVAAQPESAPARPAPPRPACRFESVILKAPPQGLVNLTFDDGPRVGATEAILEVLDRYRIPATFFLVGNQAQKNPQLTARLKAHPRALIGNHSWSHADFHRIGSGRQVDEVQRTDAVLELKDEPARLFRFPYGNASCSAKAKLHELGYQVVGWHVDSCDWGFDKTGSVGLGAARRCRVDPAHRDQFVEHVVAAVKARGGGIVLMHESHANTLAKLEEVVQRLIAEGFQFAPLTHPAFLSALR